MVSTPSVRRATILPRLQRHPTAISIHALREEGDDDFQSLVLIRDISIHALREEGDIDETGHGLDVYISIHALREEGDSFRPLSSMLRSRFLSTPSVRRATSAGTNGASF